MISKYSMWAGLGWLAAAPALALNSSFSTGAATVVIDSLLDCGGLARRSPVGEITTDDGATRAVPAPVHFRAGPRAADLYNECSGVVPDSVSEVDLDAVPVIDAGGSEHFVAYVFADNYFELYVNGTLIAIDPVPYTPFNSNIIRFAADRPLTLAVMGVDWEEHLGLGSEERPVAAFFPGDAGFVMHLQDAKGETVAVTDTSWRAQTFYTGPLPDRNCLIDDARSRDSSFCNAEPPEDPSGYSAAFWNIPENWMQPEFNDRLWPFAVAYKNQTVGVEGKPAYTNFPEIFDTPGADAHFIWSSNLVLDNLMLLRKTIE